MMAQVSTSKLTFNDETFTTGTYNGLSILIRDKDNYINATKQIHQINHNEHKRKQLKNFFKGNDFEELKDELLKKLQENGSGKILLDLRYELHQGFTNDLMGTYVHPKRIKVISMWASAKYLLTASIIMDNINIQAHLLESNGNEYLQQTIT
jgi:hypothetical protein